jgi:hypothetical protein
MEGWRNGGMAGWRGGWIAGSHTLPNSHDLPGAWLLLLLLLVLLGGVRCSAGGVIITLALALALALALTLTLTLTLARGGHIGAVPPSAQLAPLAHADSGPR